MPNLLKQKDMKARNTKTGDVVSNFGISKEFGTVSYIDSKGKVRFSVPHDGEWEIVDEEPNTDIYNVRTQAAIAAMQAILTCNDDEYRQLIACAYRDDEKHTIPNGVAQFAVACADSLVKELNRKRKETNE